MLVISTDGQDWKAHIWRQNYGRWRLIQVADMERLSLHADIDRLQRIQAHLRGRWLLLCLLRLRCATAHTHLRELLCNTLHTLL